MHDIFTDPLRVAVVTVRSADVPVRVVIDCCQLAVRVLVIEEARSTRSGIGHSDAITTLVSFATIERIACVAGTMAVTFDQHGNGIGLGREQQNLIGLYFSVAITTCSRTITAGRSIMDSSTG